MAEYPVIDVTDWEEDKTTLGKGTKEKKILIHP